MVYLDFTFSSNECYLVLFIYHKGIDGIFNLNSIVLLKNVSNLESSSFVNFPHSMWGLVESYSNLTPRGLEVPAATSESLINVNILESFLMPKKQNKIQDVKFEYMIFVWNGKSSNALIKVAIINIVNYNNNIEFDFICSIRL